MIYAIYFFAVIGFLLFLSVVTLWFGTLLMNLRKNR